MVKDYILLQVQHIQYKKIKLTSATLLNRLKGYLACKKSAKSMKMLISISTLHVHALITTCAS